MRQGKNLCSAGHRFTVPGDMNHTCPSSVHPHVQAHTPAQKHTHPLPCRHLHKRFTCILPYSPTHSLVFACRHTHDPICAPTHPHKYTCTAHCRLYARADAHGKTNTSRCTLKTLDGHSHLPGYTLTPFSCFCAYDHTPVHTCSPALRTSCLLVHTQSIHTFRNG